MAFSTLQQLGKLNYEKKNQEWYEKVIDMVLPIVDFYQKASHTVGLQKKLEEIGTQVVEDEVLDSFVPTNG